jgi:putative aminopeptidase FrvX
MEGRAAAHDTPLQRHIFFGGLTDASYAQLEGPGIPAIDLAVPTRYTHSPIETCSLDDVQMLLGLLRASLADLPARFDVTRG